MVSFAAQLLDELMGRNRNVNPDEKATDIRWDSAEVCKYFVCGFCPHDLFVNTKADLGICGKMHDEALREEYKKSSRFQKVGFEEDWIRYLESLIQDVDRRIKRGQQRLIPGAGGPPGNPKDEKAQLLSQRINELVEQAERLGCEGKVDEAQVALKQADHLRKEQRQLENSGGGPFDPPPLKQMEVCSVCGAFLIVGDAESRQREHLLGKQHVGYAQVRTTIEDFKEQKRQRELKVRADREEREKVKERERDGKRRREEEVRSRRSRSKGRRRSRSRDPVSSRSKDRRRSRSKDRRRSRSKDRRRSRSKDKRRSRSKDRRRSRSKDRRRSRSKEHRRSRSKERKRSRSKDRHGTSVRDKRRSKSRDQTSSKDSSHQLATLSRSESKERRHSPGYGNDGIRDKEKAANDKERVRSSSFTEHDARSALGANRSPGPIGLSEDALTPQANGETKEVDTD